MKKTTNIAFTKLWQDEQLRFVFHGVSRDVVRNVFNKMSRFYGRCSVTIDKAVITNGRCYIRVVAEVGKPDFDILPEADWPMMITRFLQKSVRCNVTYFDSLSKFLNT